MRHKVCTAQASGVHGCSDGSSHPPPPPPASSLQVARGPVSIQVGPLGEECRGGCRVAVITSVARPSQGPSGKRPAFAGQPSLAVPAWTLPCASALEMGSCAHPQRIDTTPGTLGHLGP
jgi:hypothetical protein